MMKMFTMFSFYTLAMIGVIVVAFLVWRNSVMGSNTKGGTIEVEESLSLNTRKTLYVIKIQNERFLIAADVDKTTFLAKLNDGENISNIPQSNFDGASFKNEEELGGDILTQKRNILKELAKKKLKGGA